ncbi:MAG: iron-sulfur cluster assembly scaffold protein [Anaerolineae bacterium]|jgi:nitrogen fixation NifU-like protein|nr:iron-sulfur cluster assembly scaffold protein [Chloroflexota bacterium]
MYTDVVMDHFVNPRNVGRLENPDGFASIKSDIHGDQVDMYIRVEDNRLSEVRILAFGCVAAIASTSITSEIATGLTLEEAEAIAEEDVERALGGLPEGKLECSVLAPKALRQAIADYRSKADGPCTTEAGSDQGAG